MGVRTRLWFGALTLVLLSLVAVVPSGDAAKSPCDECGATCMMEYRTGWTDCSGSPGGCLRTTVCP